MPFHDLNVPYTSNAQDLSHTLEFLAELGYSQVALSLTITGKLPATPPPVPLPSPLPKNLTFHTRLTLTVSDPSQNHRLAVLQGSYSLIALRPTTDKALALCCQSLECDLISLDLSVRLPFILKFKTVASALQRGVRFEICYSPGITGGSDARKNLISGGTALIRATRGRGLVISSEAKSALGLRGPWDVVNLAAVWGLGQERGKEAVCEEAGKVVRLARLKRESFRGVVDVICGGENSPEEVAQQRGAGVKQAAFPNGVKRKAEEPPAGAALAGAKPPSKREMKRRAKKARLAETGGDASAETPRSNTGASTPVLHETLTKSGT